MRIGRLFSMMLLGVLLSATPATACAWVLWINLNTPVEAFESKGACDAELRRSQPRGETGIFNCLPDTIDPRGPKGR